MEKKQQQQKNEKETKMQSLASFYTNLVVLLRRFNKNIEREKKNFLIFATYNRNLHALTHKDTHTEKK